MTTLADPMEQRDVWRSLWQFLTSDAVMITLCLIVAFGALAALALPQTPAGGTSDPVAYSRWEAGAKLREGALFEPLTALGLNGVAQTAWWRIALVALAAAAGLRLADRVARVLAARASAGAVRDESRIRVMLDAPSLDDLATRLRAQRYRIAHAQPGDTLVADRAPWAEALSIALHLGLLIAITGLMLNLLLGWEALSRVVVAGAPTLVHSGHDVTLAGDDGATMQLILQPGDAQLSLVAGQGATVDGIAVALRQITPGYRLSATTAENQPVLIRASNFVSPTTEVLLTFSEGEPERYVAVPDAGVALALSTGTGASLDQAGRVRVIAISSGSVVTDTAIAPQLTVDDTTFQFTPARGAVIDARYSPGDPLVWIGLGLALIGLIGALAWPMRRIVVRHHGGWTEFYASGRGVRQVVNQLLA